MVLESSNVTLQILVFFIVEIVQSLPTKYPLTIFHREPANITSEFSHVELPTNGDHILHFYTVKLLYFKLLMCYKY